MTRKKKAQNGRAKQKQKAQSVKSTPRNTPRSKGNKFAQQMLADDWGDDSPLHFRGFAQAGTPSKFTPGSVNTKLRHQAIAFVSAGVNESTIERQRKEEDSQIALDDTTDEEEELEEDEGIDDSGIQTNITLETDVGASEEGMAKMTIETTVDAMEVDVGPSEEIPFVVDTIGDHTLAITTSSKADDKRPAARAPSPAPSDSSEEVVVFHGRGKTATVVTDPVPPSAHVLPSRPQESTAATWTTTPARSIGWGAVKSKYDRDQPSGSSWTPASATPYWKQGKGMPRPDLAPSAEELKESREMPPKQSKVQFAETTDEKDEGGAEESIETLRANWTRVLKEKAGAKKSKVDQGDDSPKPQSSSSRRKKRGRKKDNRALRQTVVLDDDGSEAAYEDYMNNLKAQLDADEDEDDLVNSLMATSRATVAGPSLVVDGKEIADDEVLSAPLTMAGEANDIHGLHESSEWESESDSEPNPDPDELSPDESLNASDLEDDLEYTEEQQWQDEEDLRQRRLDRMSDEQIARLLSKQQEFGMDIDQLMIENGDYLDSEEDGVGDVGAARVGLEDISNFSSGRRRGKNGTRASDRKSHFPSASALADSVDQYGDAGFDIMDFDRPSLRPKKKGKKAPDMDWLSDDSLKEKLAETWEKDRATKRQNKIRREELRAEGLLGAAGRKGRADLGQKYPFGMDLGQVWDELRAFLQADDLRERAFPPMAKHDRKALHEVAAAFGLTSKSRGAGATRFPVLYKTARTPEFTPDQFASVIRASSRGLLVNRGRGKKLGRKFANAGHAARSGGGGGGGDTGAATVRNGEIVGAGARELGKENFGHRLLEKMGWSKGMALGKDGAGSLVPVEQVMRRGTAGLG